VFLDEISDISLRTQTDLLRVLQEKEIVRVGDTATVKVDFRVIAATTSDSSGWWNRAPSAPTSITASTSSYRHPAAARAPRGHPVLAKHFIESSVVDEPDRAAAGSPHPRTAAPGYHGPGNVRNSKTPSSARSSSAAKRPPARGFPLPGEPTRPVYGQRSRNIERVHIESSAETNWNLSRSARLLDIDRTTLYNKIRRYG